jgi:hypothetical protein
MARLLPVKSLMRFVSSVQSHSACASIHYHSLYSARAVPMVVSILRRASSPSSLIPASVSSKAVGPLQAATVHNPIRHPLPRLLPLPSTWTPLPPSPQLVIPLLRHLRHLRPRRPPPAQRSHPRPPPARPRPPLALPLLHSTNTPPLRLARLRARLRVPAPTMEVVLASQPVFYLPMVRVLRIWGD